MDRFFLALCVAVSGFVATARTQSGSPHRILFSRAGPGEPDELVIFVAARDGSGERRLLSRSGFDYNPAWFPDGQSLIFTSETDGQAELYRVRADGSGLMRLTETPFYDDQAAIAPDGRHAVFVSTRAGRSADLWLLDLQTREVRSLTDGPGGDFRPSWSPDGNWIAFSSDRAADLPMARGRWEHLDLNDIYVIRPDGTGLKRFPNKGTSCGSPKWSRDSRSVIAHCINIDDVLQFRAPGAQGQTRLVRIDVGSGNATDIRATDGINVAPSPLTDGLVGYVRRNSGDRGIGYSDGTRGPTGDVQYAAWSPDGQRIAFHRRVQKPRSGWKMVWSRDPRYELVMAPNMPSFHYSGDRFVTQGVAPKDSLGRGISVVESGTGTSRVLFQREGKHALAPQWSPRGDLIAFGLGTFTLFTGGLTPQLTKSEDRVDGGGQVAVISPDGSGFREVTSGQNNSGFPSLAPDGRSLVYRTFGPAGNGLRILNLADGSFRALTTEYDNFPFWSPRGDLIMFSRQDRGNFDVYTIRPDGTNLKRLTDTHGNDAHMGWSPDGEWIIFASSRTGFKDESIYTTGPQPYGELFVMRHDGGEVHQLTDNQWEDGAPAWQPNAVRK